MPIRELLLEYFSAFNEHNTKKIVEFLRDDCRVIFNDQVLFEGIEAIQPTYEKDFQNPSTGVTLINYTEDPLDENRARVLLKLYNGRLVDVTYVFETNGKKMIEHIIHSVETPND